jgi:hypothetical protein
MPRISCARLSDIAANANRRVRSDGIERKGLMRIAALACVAGLLAPLASAQVDPGYWLPESKLFGTTTIEHIDPNGVHATYPMGVPAPRLARNSVGDILVGEARELGVPSFIRVLRAGVGVVRFRLDGVPLASIPITGSDAVTRVDPATDRTHWLLRVQQSSGSVTVQHVDYLGRILESFVPNVRRFIHVDLERAAI